MRQFLDTGTGLPTADNTHEVAQATAPESRIVYTDNERRKSVSGPPTNGGLAGATYWNRTTTSP